MRSTHKRRSLRAMKPFSWSRSSESQSKPFHVRAPSWIPKNRSAKTAWSILSLSMSMSIRGTSRVLVIHELRLPQLHLVTVRVHDPCELPVYIRIRAFDDFDPALAQLRDHLVKVVDSVVDHERRVTGTEPLALFFCDVPNSEALVFSLIIRP